MGEYKDKVICDVLPMDTCHLLLVRPWQYDKHVIHHGQSKTYSFTLKGKKMTLTPLAPNPTHKTETGREKFKESALLTNEGRVKRAISKGKPVFAILVVESAPSSNPTTFHPSF